MRRFWKGVRQDLMDAHQLQEALKAPKWLEPQSYNEWKRLYMNDPFPLTINEMREKLGMGALYNNLYTSSTTTSTLTYQNYPSSYGNAVWLVSSDPAVPATVGPVKVIKDPKPETDMAWLKRRIAEVSWVPA